MENSKFSSDEFETKLNLFHEYISQITLKHSEDTFEARRKIVLESLKFNEFFSKLQQIFELDLNESFAKKLFKRICLNPDCAIEWGEIFGYQAEDHNKPVKKPESDNANNDFLDEVQIFLVSFKYRFGDASGEKAKRDIIQGIHYAPDIDSFITVAQKGAVSIWNNRLKLHTCTFLKEQTNGWLNGCCFLPNIKRVVITAERTLTFWDYRNNKQTKTNNQMNLLSIQGINALTCIDSIDKMHQHKESDKFIFGDSFGHVMTLELNSNDLSYNNTKADLVDSQRRVLDLENFKDSFVKKKIHDEQVMKIKYIPDMNSFISCSTSEKVSLLIEELYKFEKKDIRINRQVGIPKGVNTFCYCSKLNLIAAGGVDKIIRLFNPLVLNKACGKLSGHLFTIVELVFNEKDQQLISLSSERVFRVWDLTTYKCLQVFSDTENRPGERRVYCMHFDQKRDRLLTCSSVLDCWPLTRSIQDNLQEPHSHDRPIVAMCYSNNQIASVCIESFLKIWDADTGLLVFSFKEIHGPLVDVTCMTVDPTGNRLATGGSEGSIKIWNFGTGHEMKSRFYNKNVQTNPDPSIVSMEYVQIKSDLFLLVCDASNVIKMYLDSTNTNELNLIKILNGWVDTLNYEISYKKYEVIPPISTNSLGKNTSNHLFDKFKHNAVQLSKLCNHKIRTTYFFNEKNWLISADKDVILWDVQLESPVSIISSDKTSKDKAQNDISRSIESKFGNLKDKINAVLVIIKPKKIIKKDSKFQTQEDEKDSNSNQANESEATTSQVNANSSENKESDSRKSSISSVVEDSTGDTAENGMDGENLKYFIITAHNDSLVRIWNQNGELVNQISPLSAIKSSAIMSVAVNGDSKYLYTADMNGYITIWSLIEFFDSYNPKDRLDLSLNVSKVNMIVCWRAHLSKIVKLIYVEQTKLLFSASTDESIRVWWGFKGRYIGYLDQNKPFIIPKYESSEWIAPYDISEPPIFINKAKTDKKPILEKNYEYPLIVDKLKLQDPNAQLAKQEDKSLSNEPKTEEKSESFHPNERYFNALVKPKHQFNESEIQSRNTLTDGCVFSSLPLYKESTMSQFDVRSILNTSAFKQQKDVTVYSNEKKPVKALNLKSNIKIIK